MAAGRISRERKKAFRAPVVIAVISASGRDEVETLENYAACAAAVQNMQLTAHALGLASIWRTCSGSSASERTIRSSLTSTSATPTWGRGPADAVPQARGPSGTAVEGAFLRNQKAARTYHW